MKNADGVLAGVRRALKPAGRFVGEFGGHGNVASIRVALAAVLTHRNVAVVDPWYFPTAEEYRHKLEAEGFSVSSISLTPRPPLLPSAMAGWLKTFAECFSPCCRLKTEKRRVRT